VLINKFGHLLAHLLYHICTLLCAFLSCIWFLSSCFSCWLCSHLVMSTCHLFFVGLVWIFSLPLLYWVYVIRVIEFNSIMSWPHKESAHLLPNKLDVKSLNFVVGTSLKEIIYIRKLLYHEEIKPLNSSVSALARNIIY
jgi:hypothetical protein